MFLSLMMVKLKILVKNIFTILEEIYNLDSIFQKIVKMAKFIVFLIPLNMMAKKNQFR